MPLFGCTLEISNAELSGDSNCSSLLNCFSVLFNPEDFPPSSQEIPEDDVKALANGAGNHEQMKMGEDGGVGVMESPNLSQESEEEEGYDNRYFDDEDIELIENALSNLEEETSGAMKVDAFHRRQAYHLSFRIRYFYSHSCLIS